MPKQLPNYKSDIKSLYPFSEIRLVVLDLDGTILESNHSPFPDKISKLVNSLKHYRHKVLMTIATGRTLTGARQLLDKLQFRIKTPIILYNGSIILNGNLDLLRQKIISNTTFRKIIKISSLFKVKVLAYVYFAKSHSGNEPKEFALGWSSIDQPELEYNGMPVAWFGWDDVENDFTPSAMVIHTNGQVDAMSGICSELNKINDISYTRGGDRYIEIGPADCNKGAAIEYVAKSLKLSREQILAMGDNDNDASMLSWAGIGIAVESASDHAKKNCNYIAKGVLEGAIEVLRLVGKAHHLMGPQRNSKAALASIKDNAIIDHDITDPVHLNPASMFITENSIINYCKNEFNVSLDRNKLKAIINIGLLPIYKTEKQNVFLKNDIDSLLPAMLSINNVDSYVYYNRDFIEQDVIRINPNTIIDLVNDTPARVPIFYSAVRNLISKHKEFKDISNQIEIKIPYFSGSILTTLSKEVIEFRKLQLDREKKVDVSSMSQFASSAHYMGSKRSLCEFIIEAISSVLPESGVVLDLMCGSGIITGAFRKIWKTYSSDAQQFCRVLSVVHGGCLDEKAAQKLITTILPITKKHTEDLQLNINSEINIEDTLFCRNTDEAFRTEYRKFIQKFPTLPNKLTLKEWNPQLEVQRRKENPLLYPYCLFTTYFSNVYFGIRQCVEIDSLRYAIEQLKDENEKNWALGTLVTTLSALGTTYGGHFAQPKIKEYNEITLEKLSNIIETRSSSITHDFIVRLLNLSKRKQHLSTIIETVPGPWELALKATADLIGNTPALVYLDAPYKREEYSRYYHVLETLVTYNYPSCTGAGLTPKPGERFRSDFFKRDPNKITELFIKIIVEILKRGWYCAWSYSDSGIANICEVIKSVCDKMNCDVKSYSVPSVHKSQGGAKPKNVTEYLIIFYF